MISFPTGLEGILAIGILFQNSLFAIGPSSFPPWLGSLLVSLLLGATIGTLIKHFAKFGILLLVVVIVLLTLGYVSPSAMQLVLNVISPELKSIWLDASITTASGVASALLFVSGLFLAMWKT